MKSNSANNLTAAELLEQLQHDPEFVRRTREQAQKQIRMEQDLHEEERPLLADLAKAGKSVNSVWNLVNSSESYPPIIPALRSHLSRPYHPKIREGIARGLSVLEARGVVASDILHELKRSYRQDEAEFRWALANALATVGDESTLNQIRDLLADQRFREVWDVLRLAVKQITKH
jgi:HEAT repeat protein